MSHVLTFLVLGHTVLLSDLTSNRFATYFEYQIGQSDSIISRNRTEWVEQENVIQIT